MLFKKILVNVILILLTQSTSWAQKKGAQKPNVVLIYADDMGRGMLGTYGQKMLTTPHIDKLASEGLQFERAYGAMYCAPARASLITGMHDCHGGDAMTIVKAGIYKELDNGLTLDEIKSKIHEVALPAEKDITEEKYLQHLEMFKSKIGYPLVSVLPHHISQKWVDVSDDYLWDYQKEARNIISDFYNE